MESFLMIGGITAAVIVGIAWALHRHQVAEGADKMSHFAIGATLFLAVGELGKEWSDWRHDVLIPKGHFQPDGSYVTDAPPPTPHFGQQLSHVVGQALGELLRDVLVSGVAFGLAYLVIRRSGAGRHNAVTKVSDPA